ncbi:MAG TPA: hypothetical protein VGE77_02125 [Nocardioides sp.]
MPHAPCPRRLLLAGLLVLPAALSGGVLAPASAAGADEPAQLTFPDDVPTVDGSDPGAPSGLPAGWSRTSLGTEATRYLAYGRTLDGSTVHVAAATPGASVDGAEGFTLVLKTPDGDSCAQSSESRSDGDRGMVVVSLSAGPADPEATTDPTSSAEACADASTLLVELRRSTSTGVTGEADVWFRVVEEAAVVDTDGLPAPERAPSESSVDVSGEAEDRPGSADIATAPLIGTGIWRGTVPAGGQVAYRVRLGEGQTAHAELVSPTLSDDEASAVGYSASLRLSITSPMLSAQRMVNDSASLSSSQPARAQAAAGPVSYLNRYDTTAGPTLAGEYLVVIRLDPIDADGFDARPYTLRLRVDGEAAPLERTSSPTYLAGDEAGDVVPLGFTDPESADASSTVRYVAGGALVAVGLVLAAGGGLLIRRQAVASR